VPVFITASRPIVPNAPEPLPEALHAYMLGRVDLDALLARQDRLAYEVAGDSFGALILCDHPTGITIGREGSRRHVRPGPKELHAREWPLHWVGRGGGAMLHVPGQIACYPVLSLDRLKMTPAAFVAAMQQLVVEVVQAYDLPAEADARQPGVRIRGRRAAHLGLAIRNGVSTFGIILNVDPDLELFYNIHCDGDPLPMTSLQRETTSRVRIAEVRQRLLAKIAERFGFGRVSLFHELPMPGGRPVHHAITAAR
jgi:lipoyl(octanoyl) transferase